MSETNPNKNGTAVQLQTFETAPLVATGSVKVKLCESIAPKAPTNFSTSQLVGPPLTTTPDNNLIASPESLLTRPGPQSTFTTEKSRKRPATQYEATPKQAKFEKKGQPQFFRLDDKCLYNIFRYLDNIDLMRVERAHPRLKECIHRIFHPIQLYYIANHLRFNNINHIKYSFEEFQSIFNIANAESAHIFRLTDECFRHIFNYLNDWELYTLKLVHPKFGNIIESIYPDKIPQHNWMNNLMNWYSEYPKTQFNNWNAKQEEIDLLSNIDKFYFVKFMKVNIIENENDRESQREKVRQIINHFPNLIELDITALTFNIGTLVKLKHLTKLSINIENDTIIPFQTLFAELKLEYFKCSYYGDYNSYDLEAIIFCQTLKVICLTARMLNAVKNQLPHMSNLRAFGLIEKNQSMQSVQKTKNDLMSLIKDKLSERIVSIVTPSNKIGHDCFYRDKRSPHEFFIILDYDDGEICNISEQYESSEYIMPSMYGMEIFKSNPKYPHEITSDETSESDDEFIENNILQKKSITVFNKVDLNTMLENLTITKRNVT